MMRLYFLLALVASTTAIPTPDPIVKEEADCLEDDLVDLFYWLPQGDALCRDLLHIPCDVKSITESKTMTVVDPARDHN